MDEIFSVSRRVIADERKYCSRSFKVTTAASLQHHKLKFSKTAHYYTHGHLSAKTKYAWLICHGYGQAADTFIRRFSDLDPSRHYVIAPEGLSRFYWNGFHGEVVASWMTSKDRLDEIDDHTRFLHQLYNSVLQQASQVSWVMLGFSQGVATILRYLDRFRPDARHLLLWAGTFPPDLNYSSLRSYLRQITIHYFHGLQDEFITSERLDVEKQKVVDSQLNVKFHVFDGPHHVHRNTLNQFVDRHFDR